MILSALIAVTCGSLTYGSRGLFVCGDNINSIKSHIPTEQRGQLKIIDSQVDYGITDFNISFEEKGFWLFKRKFFPLQDTKPIDIVPSNGAISVGIFSELSGKQFAIIDSYVDKYSTGVFDINYTCDRWDFKVGKKGEWSFGKNVGACIGQVNSVSLIKVSHDITPTKIRLEGCMSKLLEVKDLTETVITLTLEKGLCPLYIQVENKLYKQRVKIVYFGYSNSEPQLSQPLLFSKKVFKPIGASILTGEWYNKGKIEKRFVTSKNEETVEWFTEGHLCLFAHSKLGISSEICYNSSEQEIPFYFR